MKMFSQQPAPTGNIGSLAVRASAWLAAIQVVKALTRMAQQVVLARLIAPDDFGLMGIALFTVGGAEVLSNPGLELSLIQKKGDVEGHLSTMWTCQVIRATILLTVLCLTAPLIAAYFRSPESVWVIRVASIAIFVRALVNPGTVLYQKEIAFLPRFVQTFCASVGGMIAAIIIALVLRNVWALLLGILATALLDVIASYMVHPFRPSPALAMDKVKEMFSFGGWVWLSGILVFCVTQGDDMVVTRMLGTTMLGYYQMAFWLANLPATQFTNVLSQVAFPVYSKIRDDNERLSRAFSQTLQLVLVLGVPFAIGIGILARPLTVLVFGEKWLPMVPCLMVFAVSGFLRCVAGMVGPLFLSLSRPRVLTEGQFVRMLVLGLLIFYAVKSHGTLGAAVAVAVSSLCMLIFYGLKLFGVIRIVEDMKALLAPVVAGAGLAASLLICLAHIDCTTLPRLLVTCVISAVVYLTLLLICDKLLGCNTLKTLNKLVVK